MIFEMVVISVLFAEIGSNCCFFNCLFVCWGENSLFSNF